MRTSHASPLVMASAAVTLDALRRLHAKRRLSAQQFEAAIERIRRRRVHPYGCELIVLRRDSAHPRYFIRNEATGETFDLVAQFFHSEHEFPPETRKSLPSATNTSAIKMRSVSEQMRSAGGSVGDAAVQIKQTNGNLI